MSHVSVATKKHQKVAVQVKTIFMVTVTETLQGVEVFYCVPLVKCQNSNQIRKLNSCHIYCPSRLHEMHSG